METRNCRGFFEGGCHIRNECKCQNKCKAINGAVFDFKGLDGLIRYLVCLRSINLVHRVRNGKILQKQLLV